MKRIEFDVIIYYNRYFKGENPKILAKEIGCHYVTLINRFKESKLELINSKGISLDHNYFTNINTHKKAYFLGLIMSDGCIKNNNVIISLQETDKHILEEFILDLKYNGKLYFVKKRKKSHQNQWRLEFTSKIIVENLKKMGIVERKSNKIEKVPKINKNYYNSFLLGYFDGDGTVGIDNRSNAPVFSIVGNKEFLYSVRDILDDHIYRESNNINQCSIRHKYSLDYKGKRSFFELYEYLYKNCGVFLFRKKKKYVKILKNLNTKNNRNKKILQCDMHGNIIKIFNTPIELKQEFGLNSLDKIHKCIRGINNSSMGYKWKVEEYGK